MRKHVRHIRRSPGITLVELAIAIFITGIVSTGLFSVFSICLKSWDVFTEKAKMSMDVNIISNSITRDIRESLEIIETGEYYIKFKTKNNEIYSYILQDKIIYKNTAPLIENVTAFKISSDIEKRFFSFIIQAGVKNISFSYKTGATRRNSQEL